MSHGTMPRSRLRPILGLFIGVMGIVVVHPQTGWSLLKGGEVPSVNHIAASAFAAKPAVGTAATPPEHAARALRGLVFIRTPKGMGSGFVVKKEQSTVFIVTNLRLVRETFVGGNNGFGSTYEAMEVVFFRGTEREVRRKTGVYAVFETGDLAMLRVENCPEGVQACPLAKGAEPYETMPVTVLGYIFDNPLTGPHAKTPTHRQAYISSLRYGKTFVLERLQIDRSFDWGNCGGPVLNGQGEVMGVAVVPIAGSGMDGTEITFAVAGNRLQCFLDGALDFFRRPAGFDFDKLKGRREVKTKMILADPFQRIVEFGLLRHNGPPPIAAIQAPFSALGEPVLTRKVTPGSDLVVPLVVVGDGRSPVWYQVWVRHKDTAKKTYFAPFAPGQSADRYDRLFAAAERLERGSVKVSRPDPRTNLPMATVPDDLFPAHEMPASDWSLPAQPGQKIRTIDMPGHFKSVRRADQGRLWVVQLENVAALAVLDFEHGVWRGFLPFPDGSLFAAGGRRLVVSDSTRTTLTCYDLATLKPIATRKVPVDGPVFAMGMGLYNEKRLVLLFEGGREYRLSAALYDLEHFQLYPLEMSGRAPRRWVYPEIFMDPLARFFFLRSSNQSMLRYFLAIEDGKVAVQFEKVGFATGVSPHGITYGSKGMGHHRYQLLSVQDQILAMDPQSGCYLLVDQRGYRDKGTWFGVTLFDPTGQKVARLDDVYLALGEHSVSNPLPRLFFDRTAKYLAYVGEAQEAVYVVPIDIQALAKRQNRSYLFLASKLGGVVAPDRPFQQAIEVWSSSGGVTYKLIEGPPGLTVSGTGRLVWDRPYISEEPRGHQARILVSNREKIRLEHHFFLQVMP